MTTPIQTDSKDPSFEPGTTTNLTAERFWEIAREAVKNELHCDVAELRPVFGQNHAGSVILGVKVVHADPKPRAPRSDKGVPKGPRSAPPTSTPTGDKKPAVGPSPFGKGATEQKAAL